MDDFPVICVHSATCSCRPDTLLREQREACQSWYIEKLINYRDEIRNRLESYIESGDAILVAQWGGELNAIENALARTK